MNIGDRVVFSIDVFAGRKKPMIGTLRKILNGEGKCDDGDPANADLRTNGFRVSAWVPLTDLEVVK